MQDMTKFEDLLDELIDAYPALKGDISSLKDKMEEESQESPEEADKEMTEGEEGDEQVLLGGPKMAQSEPKEGEFKPIPKELQDDEEEEDESITPPAKIHGSY